MKILPINLNNSYKKSNFANINISTSKPIAHDSINFTNKFQQKPSKEDVLYSKAEIHAREAQKIKNDSKKILKRSKRLIDDGIKIAQQSCDVLEKAKSMIEEYHSIGEAEVYTQNALGQKTAEYRVLADGSHYIAKLAPNGSITMQVIMSADKRKCSVIKLDPHNPAHKDIWEFENNKLTKFDKNQTNLRDFYARKTFYYSGAKTPNKIDVYDKGETMPFENYYLNESGNLTRYSKHTYFGNENNVRKDYFFGLNGLRVYHSSIDEDDPNVEITYDMNGKYQKIAILDSCNILAEYGYDLDGAPAYITLYKDEKEHYLCLIGKAIKWE